MTETRTETSSGEQTPSGDRILRRVQFDERLPRYFLIMSVFGLTISVIGIPLIPFWILGLGQYVHRRQYDSLESELTERTLNIRKGFLFRTQTNVPLDKITDLALNEGPVLRRLGLCTLSVETAGGGAGTSMGQAQLTGVVDAIGFRDAVMRQRDLVVGGAAALAAPVQAGDPGEATLTEVRDVLVRIERLLTQGLDRA